MAKLSPEALQRIAEALPDTYSDNPDQFVTDWQTAQAERQDLERLRGVNRWYEESYQPWYRTYGGDFEAFEAWKQRPPETSEPATPAPHGPESLINFDDDRALRQVYDHFDKRLSDVTQALETRANLLDSTIQTRTEEMQRLLALQEQAYGILNEAVYNKIEPGWRPNVDIPQVVSYAQQHNIPDLRRAYEGYTQADREKALSDQAYQRGLEEGKRAATASQVTTEMTTGSPYRHAVPERRRGYGNVGVDEIIAASQARTARRGLA